ncbi:DUF4102 domain-containing protein [Bartonella rattaustraliani]|uniref:DUF4102 domain-containing protein n=1 Tax=Bartonella rattaustraliani TaxID=481139 RepID=UPI001FCB1FC3|nr:DUF4102 domain-containing protein [Bartonella rattaustraliani]
MRRVNILGSGKVNDGAGLPLHKRKDGDAQWIYRYTIHRQTPENRLKRSKRNLFKTSL